MIEDPNLDELWRVKESIAGRFASVKDYALAVQKLAAERPLPPAGKMRKMIEGFPRGQSVADDDETLRELRQVREKLLKEAGGDLRKFAEGADRQAAHGLPTAAPRRKVPGKIRKTGSFRTTKGKSTPKHRGNGHR